MASETYESSSSTSAIICDESSELSELDSTLPDDLGDLFQADKSKPPSKLRRVRATITWAFFRKLKNNEQKLHNNRRAHYCSICNKMEVISSNARRHLKERHGILVEVQGSLVKRASENNIQNLMAKQKEHAETLNKKKLDQTLKECINKPLVREALAQLIVVRNLPYRAATWPELHVLFASVNYMAYDVLPTSPTTVQELIAQSYKLDKEILKKRLKTSLSSIHIDLDVWASPNRKNFLAIVAHFVDAEFQLRKALLALPFLPEGHGGSDQIDPLWNTLVEYEIPDKIGYCVGDNHGSNDLLLRRLAHRLSDEGYATTLSAAQRRIRCRGHVINIAVQAFFFCPDKAAVDAAFDAAKEQLRNNDEVDPDDVDIILQKQFKKSKLSQFAFKKIGPIGKLHNVVVAIRHTNELYQAFVRAAGRIIPLDNETRWNSWYQMVKVALGLRREITKFQEDHYTKFADDDILTPSDWALLADVATFLQPFERVILQVQGDKVKYASQPKLHDAIIASWHAFDKYYLKTDEVIAYGAALLLAPHRRDAYLKRNWLPEWREAILNQTRALWLKRYKDKYTVEEVEEESVYKEPDAYDLFEREQAMNNIFIDEFDHFVNSAAVNLPTKASALDWWLEPANRKAYPSLSRMAIEILSIPAMSAEPERIFSGARRTITWSRFKLGADSIEMGECLKSWIKTGLVAEWRKELLDDLDEEEPFLDS